MKRLVVFVCALSILSISMVFAGGKSDSGSGQASGGAAYSEAELRNFTGCEEEYHSISGRIYTRSGESLHCYY